MMNSIDIMSSFVSQSVAFGGVCIYSTCYHCDDGEWVTAILNVFSTRTFLQNETVYRIQDEDKSNEQQSRYSLFGWLRKDDRVLINILYCM